jgi:hypothetical protein
MNKNKHWKVSKPRTPEMREEKRKSMLKMWENEDYRKSMSEKHRGQKNNKGKHWKNSEDFKEKKREYMKVNNPMKRKEIADKFRGEKCHFWKNGISFEPYSTDWTETLRRSIRERDHYTCQLCNQYGNVIHHIDYNKKNCDVNNLINLCNKCNARVNSNRNYWTNYFNNLMEVKTNGSIIK